MGDVKFGEEENFKRKIRSHHQEKEVSFLTKFLIKISGGLIKDQQQANKVMLIITIILFSYSAYLMITKVLA